jgi:hypothetical protein
LLLRFGLKTRDGRGIQAKNSKNDYFGDEHKKAASGQQARAILKCYPHSPYACAFNRLPLNHRAVLSLAGQPRE